ncbi:putative membrane-anchored protein [Rhizobium lentis]|uniref:Putative membrane-anchored protein n=1 Tax=Rhizobium lentis TaxID=1138194 RepID=A0A7W8XEI6_9HYPH|nr:putative membrane-anchored protein [Rhizobium lentis]MBB5550220.1 putative membrane-anchored protein [Rhizobium lentis]MBB5560751.1 putative membrane-anchored protein [Rhizobium lentis]MBB5567337.1 putative membrane-anchored protein [Rhizobium lentis]
MGIEFLRRYFAAAMLFASLAAQAEARPYQEMFPGRTDFSDGENSLLEKLDFQQGVIKLPEAKATLNLPANFYYLSPADTKTVLVDIWGNPPAAADGMLGMIFGEIRADRPAILGIDRRIQRGRLCLGHRCRHDELRRTAAEHQGCDQRKES